MTSHSCQVNRLEPVHVFIQCDPSNFRHCQKTASLTGNVPLALEALGKFNLLWKGVQIPDQGESEFASGHNRLVRFKVPVVVMHGKIPVIFDDPNPIEHWLREQIILFQVAEFCTKHLAPEFFLNKRQNGPFDRLPILSHGGTKCASLACLFSIDESSRNRFWSVYWRGRFRALGKLANQSNRIPRICFAIGDIELVDKLCIRTEPPVHISTEEEGNEAAAGTALACCFMGCVIRLVAHSWGSRPFQIANLKRGVARITVWTSGCYNSHFCCSNVSGFGGGLKAAWKNLGREVAILRALQGFCGETREAV